MEETFENSPFRFILDRPHAKEHLAKLSKALALGDSTAETWAKEALDKFERGDAVEVVDELRAAYDQTGLELLRCGAGYFDRNQDAVEYASYRDKGWSTASSEVESAHRHVVQIRLKIAGAWWDPENVPNILALRMLKANDWWGEYWDSQRLRWQERAASLRQKGRRAA